MEDPRELACKKCESIHERDPMPIYDWYGNANHLSYIGVKEL